MSYIIINSGIIRISYIIINSGFEIDIILKKIVLCLFIRTAFGGWSTSSSWFPRGCRPSRGSRWPSGSGVSWRSMSGRTGSRCRFWTPTWPSGR